MWDDGRTLAEHPANGGVLGYLTRRRGTRPLLERPGAIRSIALGTPYALRVPSELWTDALEKGAEQVHRYGVGGEVLDPSRESGSDWFFGFWHEAEPSWCRAAFDVVHRGSS